MPTYAANTTATISSSLRYRDALAAIGWLCRAFGFGKNAVYSDDKGVMQHAQLVFGNGMIMLGSVVNNSAWGEHVVQPDENRRARDTTPLRHRSDCAARYARAKAAGAMIVDELATKEYGGAG